jgi:SPP1 family phage portal protein
MDFTTIKPLLQKLIAESIYTAKMKNRYTAKYIPISYEENPAYIDADIKEKCKPDRRLYNHFEKDIVDTKTSYFIGNPVVVTERNEDKEFHEYIRKLNIRLDYEDTFSEITKEAAITGKGGILLYKDSDAQVTGMAVPATEFKVFYKLKEPVHAIRRYIDEENVERLEAFDKEYIYPYQKVDGVWSPQEPVLHGFRRVPLIEVINNTERYSDFHSVTLVIDAYNRLVSDLSNEVETFRTAYLVLRNMSATEEDLLKLRRTGAISIDGDGEVFFLTKKIDTAAIAVMREVLESNINKFSSNVDFSSADFVSNVTRVAVAYKVRPLEQKTRTFELKFKNFLKELYRTAFSFIGNAKAYDYMDLDFMFTRNLPVNISEEIDMLVKLEGQVSDEKRYSMMSFITDPKAEIRALQAQKGIEVKDTDLET